MEGIVILKEVAVINMNGFVENCVFGMEIAYILDIQKNNNGSFRTAGRTAGRKYSLSMFI